MHASYTHDMTMKNARDRYFEANGFGADGGYNDAWVDFKLGPVPFPFPNTASRVVAVKFHDLHHILTGYETNPVGEFEISAWEIAGGCERLAAAWVLNLSGMAAGLLVAPRRIFNAFVRGRRGRNLYREPFAPLLDATVGELRATFISNDERPATAREIAAFGAAAVAGAAVGIVLMAVVLPLMPIGLVTNWLKRRTERAKHAAHGSAA